MNINSELKKAGIKIINKLDTLTTNSIAISVSSKLCLAFPDHNLNKSELFESFSRLNMYIASMPEDSSGAKYFFKNNSIYFRETSSVDEMSNLATHECIHFIQELYDSNNGLFRMGLYDFDSNIGLALNEAAVQLMASEANMVDNTHETYYGITINTNSPNYYPLECTLLNEIAYFTGKYPLYHSTLNGNDVFKNTFILKSDKKTYSTICKNFDKILSLESNLNDYINELQLANKSKDIHSINLLINKCKENIKYIFFQTQNLIISKFFKSEFNNIRNMEDIKDFKNKIYNFQNILGYSNEYTFYNEFYRQMMIAMEEKSIYVEKYGEINLFENVNNSLMLIDSSKNVFSFISNFAKKLKKLVGLNKAHNSINDI